MKKTIILKMVSVALSMAMLWSTPVFAQDGIAEVPAEAQQDTRAVWTKYQDVEFEEGITVRLKLLINDYGGASLFTGCQVYKTSWGSGISDVEATAKIYDGGQFIAVSIHAYRSDGGQFSRGPINIYPR